MSLSKSFAQSATRLGSGISGVSCVRPAVCLLSSPTGVRFASKKKTVPSSHKITAKQLAAQRERKLATDQAKRKEEKKLRDQRLEAKRPLDTSLYLDTLTALRYIRAAEVGQSASSTTISMNVRVIADRGTQPISGSVKFPKSLSTDQRIAVFTSDPLLAEEAKDAGAVVVGGDELIEQVKNGNINFNKAFATPDMASKLNTVARILGPKGLMPSARRGTITTDITQVISNTAGAVDFRQRSVPAIAIPVARASFTDAEVVKNLIAAIDAVREAASRVNAKKPVVLGQTTISSTRGPGIVIEV